MPYPPARQVPYLNFLGQRAHPQIVQSVLYLTRRQDREGRAPSRPSEWLDTLTFLLTTDGHGQASLTLALIPNGASVSAARLCRSVVLATKSTKGGTRPGGLSAVGCRVGGRVPPFAPFALFVAKNIPERASCPFYHGADATKRAPPFAPFALFVAKNIPERASCPFYCGRDEARSSQEVT